MKIIIRVLVLLSVVWGLISCGDNKPIKPFVKQNVILASGFNWDTAKIVAINTLTGKEIVPCKNTTDNVFVSKNPIDTKQEQIQYNPKSSTVPVDNPCNTKIIVDSENPALAASLRQALKLSESIIKGTVRVNGVDREARFVSTLTALYKGSHCATIYSGGQELVNCINREEYCKTYQEENPGQTC